MKIWKSLIVTAANIEQACNRCAAEGFDDLQILPAAPAEDGTPQYLIVGKRPDHREWVAEKMKEARPEVLLK